MNIGAAISVINDPFNQNSMTAFRTSCYRDFHGKWSYRGYIEFENGKTKGEQQFEADSLKSLLIKMEAFVEELE